MKKIFTLISAIAISACTFAQTLSVKDVAIKASATAEVNVDIEGATVANGAGMIVTLPAGFTFVDDEGICYGGEDVFYWNSKKKAGHAISENLQAPNKVKVAIVDTSSNSNFIADSGSLFTFVMAADASVTNGEYEGVISSIEFSTGESKKYEDVKFKIVVGDATAINALNADEAGSTIYNVAGTVQNNMKKGVNIVKMNNGQVKKVMVK